MRRNKGAGRPINPEHERAEVLAALACVDAVVMFDDDTPAAHHPAACSPTCWSRGQTGAADQIVGRDTVEARGGRVVRVTVEPGYSTSALVDKVRSL